MAAGNLWRDSVNYTANNGIWASNGATVMVSAGTTPGRRHSVQGITHGPGLVLAVVRRCVAMAEVRQRRDGSAGSLPARRHLSRKAAAPTQRHVAGPQATATVGRCPAPVTSKFGFQPKPFLIKDPVSS